MICVPVIGAILWVVLGSPQSAAAEEQQSALPDTVVTDRVVIVDPGLSLGTPTLLLPRSLDEGTTFAVPPFMTREGSSGQRLPFLIGPLRQEIDMLAPLHLQWERERKLQSLYTVLGAVQIGGVAYIAYRHIKKYGLLK